MKQLEDLVSIVIPYYNKSYTLKRCLDSVVMQTYTNYEIIIVDDCSNDWEIAANIIQTYENSSIIVIRHESNLNGSAARNTGFKNAKGKFIALLDSDDEWYPDHLFKCIEFQKKINESNFLIYSSIKVSTGSRNDIHYSIKPNIQERIVSNVCDSIFCDNNTISCVTYFYPKKLALKFLFDESLLRFQDIEFILRISNYNIPIYQSPHLGAIVHWEGNTLVDSIKKGANVNFIENFIFKYDLYFTEKAKARFLIRSLLPIQFYYFEVLNIYKTIKKYKLIRFMTIYDWFYLIAYMTIQKNITLWNFVKKISNFKSFIFSFISSQIFNTLLEI
jgi:amylovoran biosynthesis glycosyltransferase AmsB